MGTLATGWKTDETRHHLRGSGFSWVDILKWFFNLLGPVVFTLSMSFTPFDFMDARTHQIVAVALWMLIWWITEFVPLPVTSLLPIILFPSFEIIKVAEVVKPYSSSVIFLFLGGFIIALALEKWNIHRRIALFILKIMGARADSIVLGFIIASAFLSMWISNTATAVMMLPIILSVVDMIAQKTHGSEKSIHNLKISMLLGMAYGANVGGMGTLIGTPPNAILAGYLRSAYSLNVGFLDWMLFALPIVVVLLFIIYIFLTKFIYPNKMGHIDGFKEMVDTELHKMGKMSKEEKMVFGLFLTAAFLWISRSGINALLGTSIGDTSIAVFVGILFFLIPTSSKSGERLLEWKDTRKLPWGVLLLFGGGLSIASALSGTGILTHFANTVSNIEGISFVFICLILLLVIVVLTELMSNTALATIFLPIIASIGVSFGIDPVAFAAPLVLAMSCVFSLPMGTPPNAVIFASGELHISNMIKVGAFLDPIAVLTLSLIGFRISMMIF